jgi:predicted metalloprotease
MELNDNAELGSGQVEDLRGSGGGGFGGFGGGGGGGRGGIGLPIGGGKIGLIITLIIVVAGVCLGGAFGTNILGGGGGSANQPADNASLEVKCGTANPNRFQNEDCRNWLYVTSIQTFWTDAMPQYFNKQYTPATTRFFTDSVNTGCGQADTGVGPFYCQEDKHVYIDLTFYQELSNKFGAKGEFAAPYVLAHEYGHHIQDLVGAFAKAQAGGQQGATSGSVRLELQADCYAGVWANHASSTKDAKGRALFTSITEQDIQDAVDTAGTIGDDTIQKKSGGQVNQDTFTHGTSAQRQRWFSAGYNGGTPANCDTFGTNNL